MSLKRIFSNEWVDKLKDISGINTIQNFLNAFEDKSFTTNGWQKLPSGLIIQWGISQGISVDSSATITLPKALSTQNFAVIVIPRGSIQTAGGGEVSVDSVGLTSFVIRNGQDFTRSYFFVSIGI